MNVRIQVHCQALDYTEINKTSAYLHGRDKQGKRAKLQTKKVTEGHPHGDLITNNQGTCFCQTARESLSDGATSK